MYRNLFQRLDSLRREAAKSTNFRGHRMRWSLQGSPMVYIGICRKCGAEVICKDKPAANEIDIGGEAVALSCREGRL